MGKRPRKKRPEGVSVIDRQDAWIYTPELAAEVLQLAELFGVVPTKSEEGTE